MGTGAIVLPRTKTDQTRIRIINPTRKSKRLKSWVCILTHFTKIIVAKLLNNRIRGCVRTKLTRDHNGRGLWRQHCLSAPSTLVFLHKGNGVRALALGHSFAKASECFARFLNWAPVLRSFMRRRKQKFCPRRDTKMMGNYRAGWAVNAAQGAAPTILPGS